MSGTNPGSASAPSRWRVIVGSTCQARNAGRAKKEERADAAAARRSENRDIRRGDCNEQGHQHRTDDEDHLDEHRFERIRRREQRFVAQPSLEERAHADRDRRKGRSGSGCERKEQPCRQVTRYARHESTESGGEQYSAGGEDAARPVAVYEPAQDGRDGREPGDVGAGGRSTLRKGAARRLDENQNGQAGNADRQPADHRCGKDFAHFARLQQRGVASEGNHGVAVAKGPRLSHARAVMLRRSMPCCST